MTKDGFTMTIPSFDEFIEPLLQVLAEHPVGLKASAAYEETADAVGLSSELREELLPSGKQEVYKNRIGWAHDRLKKAELSHCPSWGVWKLTEKGQGLLENRPEGLNGDEIERIARPRKYDEASGGDAGLGSEVSTADDDAAVSTRTPQERIDAAIAELYESISEQLLELIHEQSDRFFENLVLDVLREMGYGAGREAIKHRGGVHDSGIDGIISLDRLGLEKVYIQAKRWKDRTVGRPDVQGFSGALQGQKASKGVFITTSNFSSHAEEFARQVSDSIVLIDGARLTSLMIEYGVGVQTERIVRVVEADRDYFEEL